MQGFLLFCVDEIKVRIINLSDVILQDFVLLDSDSLSFLIFPSIDRQEAEESWIPQILRNL